MNVKIETLVARQEIGERDTIVDCGGYKGDYTAEVLKANPESVVVFEPRPDMYEKCVQRFKDIPQVRVLKLGVGKEGWFPLYLREDGSSIFKEWAGREECINIQVVKLSSIVGKIDVLKINCEGCEYEVIKDLYETGVLPNIREVLVQFHRVPGWKEWFYECQKILEKTHIKVYSFKWELWKRG